MSKAAGNDFFDEDVAARADDEAEAATAALIDGDAAIHFGRDEFHVVAVDAPAGAGKSYFVRSVTAAVVEEFSERAETIVVATPTNDQAHATVRGIAERLRDVRVAFVPASNRALPEDVAALPNVDEIHARAAHSYAVVVGTLDKLGDAHARGDLPAGFRFLAIDEAYQAHSGQYFKVAGLANRHLLVGDPGQLAPFSTMADSDRWRGLPDDPLQTAVAVVRANHDVPLFRLPITRRLSANAVPLASSFYRGHNFDAWTLPGVRRMRYTRNGNVNAFDDALDMAAVEGWCYLRLPGSPVLTADPTTIEAIAGLLSRLRERCIEVASERTEGAWSPLTWGRVAVAVSHNDQKDHLRAALDDLGYGQIRVDTANKLQGLEFDVVIAWHPLAGLPAADGFHLDPGRLCVMLTRHRHACIVVGRSSDAALIDAIPPLSDAWLGSECDPEVDGWFAHRRVFDHLAEYAIDLE